MRNKGYTPYIQVSMVNSVCWRLPRGLVRHFHIFTVVTCTSIYTLGLGSLPRTVFSGEYRTESFLPLRQDNLDGCSFVLI